MAFQSSGGTNIIEKGDWKALISLLVVLLQAVSVLPTISEGGSITRFSDEESSAEAFLAAAGKVTFANISVPVGSILINGSVGISPLPVQGAYPLSPGLDIGADGSPDWAFEGTGYGAFGRQTRFADGSLQQDINFTWPGIARCNITLPGNATVMSARIELCGTAGQKWWNASWHHRIPLNLTELAGADQTDFVVELLLDTRNWTLGSAEKEFRVTRENATTCEEAEVPIQVIDELNNGSKCFEASLLFAVQNLSANATLNYNLYYDNPGATQRSPLFSDFRPRLIQNRLLDQTAAESIIGPLLSPAGASFDRYGNYWVADTARHCVFGYTRMLGVPDISGSDGSHLSKPMDVVATPSGKVAVCDSGNFRVQVFEPDGTVDFTLGQTGVPGTDNGHFFLPAGLGTDGDGWLYVTDASLGTMQRVQVFDTNGTYLSTLGEGSGQGNYQFGRVAGIYVSPSKEILVADSGNHRVQAYRYVSQGNWSFNFTIGVTGQAGTDSAHLDSPADVTMDDSGRIFIADYGNSRVQVFSGPSFVSSIGVLKTPIPDNLHLNMPSGVAVSPDGSVYVSDYVPRTDWTSRIVIFDSQYERVRNMGDRHWTGLAGPGASDSELNLPSGVTSDASGRIFVSDTYNHRVQVFGALGQFLATVGVTGVGGNDSSHFYYPRGLDVGPDGRLLVADGGNSTFMVYMSNHRVMEFYNLSSGIADMILGVTGQAGNDASHLNGPWDVSVDRNGRVGVADTGYYLDFFPTPLTYGQRVQIYNHLADMLAADSFGVAGAAGNDSTHLNWPAGVGLSDNGWTYVADTGNSRVVMFKNDGDHSADLIINAASTPGSGTGQLRLPLDVDVDSRGRIYVADSGNHRVEIYSAFGLHEGMIGETGVSLSDEFHLNAPGGIHLGDDGKIYIADTQNNRVMRVTRAGLSAGQPERVAVPEDVALDLGADGSVDWRLPGVLDGTHTASPLAAPLNALLANLTGTPDGFGNPMVTFPIDIINGGRGRLAVFGISLDYDCLLKLERVSMAIEPYLANASHANASAEVLVPLSYSAASAGGIRLSGLNITADFPPRLVSPVPDLFMDEDTANESLCDFSFYFQDDIDARLGCTLVNVSNSTIADVIVVNGSVLSVDCTVGTARDWNGMVAVVARATDSSGLSALSNQFHVIVRPVNDPPRITGQPPPEAWVGEEWRYDIAASDPENDTLSYALEKGPAGMALNRSSGRLVWTPTQAQLGPWEVSVRVSDGELGAVQDFFVNASGPPAGNHPPRIMSAPVTYVLAGAEYLYTIIALDDDNDTLSYSLVKSPQNMTIGERTGVIKWTPNGTQKGIHEIIARVSDSKSNCTQAFNMTVVGDLSELLPVILITQPSPNATVSGKIWLKGAAAAAAPASIISVEVSADGGKGWQPASGKTAWMCRIDTAKLPNGARKMLVRATDSANRSSEANITFAVQNAPASGGGFLGVDNILWILLLVVICAAAGAGAYAYMRRRKRAPPVPAGPLTAAQYGAPQGTASSIAPGEPSHPSSSSAPVPSSPASTSPAFPPSSPPAPGAPSFQAVSSAAPAASPAISPSAQKPRHAARAAPPPQKPVDSAFLIYHDGRLITYFSRSDSIKLDDTLDMIRRFVKASFSGELGRLDAMAYENMNIIMERGNLMYMVVITPLTQYEPLRRQMRGLLDDIDRRYRVVFKIWDGDFGKVKGIRSMVESFAGEKAAHGAPEEPPRAQKSPPPPPPQEHPPSYPSRSSSFPYLSSQPSQPLPSSPPPSSQSPSPLQPTSVPPPMAWDDSQPIIPTPQPLPPPQPKGTRQSDEK
jgi:sugar lactone lactonase YvrE